MTEKKLSPREVALYAILGALMFAAKMAMAQLPNIEPVSLMVMLLAVCFGWRGLYAVYLYIFLEFAVWGMDLWSACYLYVWLVLFCFARLLRRMQSALGWAVLAGFFGLLFGALCALTYWVVGGWAAAVTWWISGIPMDILHGAGNFAIALILFKPLRQLTEKLKTQYGVE